MRVGKNIYRVVRTVIFGAIILVAALFVLLYVAVSLPPVQERIKGVAESYVSEFLGVPVTINKLEINPFNEVVLRDVSIPDPEGNHCISIERLGAGIRMSKLIFERKIELTYGEVIGLDGTVTKASPDAPMNIDFIIQALKPKEKNKPKPKIDLKLRSIVLRKSKLSYDNLWQPKQQDPDRMDFNHLKIINLRADLNIPQLNDTLIAIDLRRLSMREQAGLAIESLRGNAEIAPDGIKVSGLAIELPSSALNFSDLYLPLKKGSDIKKTLETGNHSISITKSHVNPSDLRSLLPLLDKIHDSFNLNLSANGNLNAFTLDGLNLSSVGFNLEVAGDASRLDEKRWKARLSDFSLTAAPDFVSRIIGIMPKQDAKISNIITSLGAIKLDAEGEYNGETANVDAALDCNRGSLAINVGANIKAHKPVSLAGNITTDGIDLTDLIPNQPLGMAQFTAEASVRINGKNISGNADLTVDHIEYGGNALTDILVSAWKEGEQIRGTVSVADDELAMDMDGSLDLSDKKSPSLIATLDIGKIRPAMFGLMKDDPEMKVSGKIFADLRGSNIDNATGELAVSNFRIANSRRGNLNLESLTLAMEEPTDNERHIHLRSDWVDGDITGSFSFSQLPGALKYFGSRIMPEWFDIAVVPPVQSQKLEFDFNVKKDNELTRFFKLPVTLLVDVPITGAINQESGQAWLEVDVPYLQQGRDKLIQASSLKVDVEALAGFANLKLQTILPGKDNTNVSLALNARAHDNHLGTNLAWDFNRKQAYRGAISLDTEITRNPLTGKPDVALTVNPSQFEVNDTAWSISRGTILYSDKKVVVNNISGRHGSQFVEMQGTASESTADTLNLRLRDVNLDYVFSSLNINYVNFGGIASGDFYVTAPFSKNPVAYTDALRVKGLKYNNAVLGDAVIKSGWRNEQQMVSIYADIKEKAHTTAIVDGGIWVTRDSLSFDFTADKVNARFLGPFMEAFTSDVSGRASGKCKLYGTFADINLTGRVFANEIKMLLDYTNVYYTGTDSVFMTPGLITIPGFRIYDRNGNSALLTGQVTHNYFHEPTFNFHVTDASKLLCYDTNPKLNPDWYGTVYASGGGTIKGYPGYVGITLDMTTDAGSDFTFVLNDTEAAEDYQFLTFSDRRKELAQAAQIDTVVDYVAMFRKKIQQQVDHPSIFALDLRASVRPSTTLNIIMDPIGGDKITARGNGYMQMAYDSDSDELTMYGKYTVDEGSYLFTLQDIIIKDFTIRRGSSISFNGDPYNAILNIDGLYRVNTNLSDLDKSFATDRDLNRTNIPVDAVLKVTGPLLSPEINFDIELPTVNQDVTRKLKAIISTEDMMNRQIIYLLALNRFYTPEYMGGANRGNELASVASTTISSQLANILGQISDTWTIAPSFRSDKGDFSDIEADLTLSSRLLNNRLLINGNFGYRDRSTSSTTFVGDFDIEYLLNRSGNLRLKAYNHYNDQNYYLRSALTTQGIGVMYRHDFNRLFKNWFKKKDKNVVDTVTAPNDSVFDESEKLKNIIK